MVSIMNILSPGARPRMVDVRQRGGSPLRYGWQNECDVGPKRHADSEFCPRPKVSAVFRILPMIRGYLRHRHAPDCVILRAQSCGRAQRFVLAGGLVLHLDVTECVLSSWRLLTEGPIVGCPAGLPHGAAGAASGRRSSIGASGHSPGSLVPMTSTYSMEGAPANSSAAAARSASPCTSR